MRFFARVLITALILLVVAKIVPGISLDGLLPALIAGLSLGVLNAVVRPFLVILTLPVTILTLGLFIFIINACLFLFTSSFIDGFYVSSFPSALVGSIITSILSSIANKFV